MRVPRSADSRAGRSALALAQALDQLGHRVVVVEIDGERATRFALNENIHHRGKTLSGS